MVDYDKGSINEDNFKKLRDQFKGPIYVDSKKKELSIFKNSFVKINQKEFEESKSLPKEDFLIVTLGDRGAKYKEKIFSIESVEVMDVCGAGDTFLAALVFHHLTNGNLEHAIVFANKASAITVRHRGTYAPTLKEIYET